MNKIAALDFANYVNQQKQILVQHCRDNGINVSNTNSLGYIVGANENINLPEGSEDKIYRTVYNYDGTIISKEEVHIGDAIVMPTEPPTIDDTLIEFDTWICTTNAQTVSGDYDIAALVKVREQISVDGELVRPTIIQMMINDRSDYSPSLKYIKSAGSGQLANAYIDWGDGTIDTILASAASMGSVSHTYSSAGIYNIKLYSTKYFGIHSNSSPSYPCGNSVNYHKNILKIYGGDNMYFGSCICYVASALSLVTLSSNTYTIGNYNTFYGTANLKFIATNCDVTYCKSAFNSSGLKTAVIGTNTATLPDSLFEACYALERFIIPSTVTTISQKAFRYCYTLNIKLANTNIQSIATSAFEACNGITHLILPNSLTNLGTSAFRYCYNLKTIILGNNLSKLDNTVFEQVFNVKSLDISNITDFHAGAVSLMTNLQELNLSEHLVAYQNANNSYISCSKLTIFTIPEHFNFVITVPPKISKESLLGVARNLIDLTGQTSKTITVYSTNAVDLDIIKVNSSGQENVSGTMTLKEYIQSKNWTISVNTII